MQLKRLAALAAASVMAFGICGVIPVNTDFNGISVAASAAGDFTIKTDSDGFKYVAAYTGRGGKVTIPKDVSYVADEAFKMNDSITSITFPKTCTVVQSGAFSQCPKLAYVVFEGNANIFDAAFEKCVNLKSVTVNGSLVGGIGGGAFYNCQTLSTVKIKENKEKFWIGEEAFCNCYSLMNINIPDKCTEIYGGAFLNCFSLTSLTIPAKTKINTKDHSGKNHFGYVMLFPTEEDCIAFIEGEEQYRIDTYVAGGKTGYSEKFTVYPGSSYLFYYEAAQYTPKALTLTVTKGSPAEDWAKANKIKYKYAPETTSKPSTPSSGDSLAAPTGIKTSKTSSRVTLTWNSVSGADAYRIYIYDPDTGEYEQYKDVSETKCTISGLKSGATYKFKVAALEESGGKYKAGKRSKVVSVTTK